MQILFLGEYYHYLVGTTDGLVDLIAPVHVAQSVDSITLIKEEVALDITAVGDNILCDGFGQTPC